LNGEREGELAMAEKTEAGDRIAFLLGLRAVRNFRPDPVPEEVIDDLLRVARWSGSASNRQPWEVILIRDRAALKALSEVEGYAKHLGGATLGLALVMSGDPEREEHEIYDEGRLSERLMLAAEAHGVGSCIGWVVGDGVAAAKTILGIPAERRLRTLLSLGYPDEAAQRARTKPAQARKPLREIVHEERYS
jgi:nitroreductase